MNVESLFDFIGVLIVALLSFFSAIFVANRQAKANDSDIQNKVDEALWQRTQKQLEKMAARIDALEKSDEEKDAQIAKLKTENALQKANMSEMAKRLKEMELELKHERSVRIELERENEKLKNGNSGGRRV